MDPGAAAGERRAVVALDGCGEGLTWLALGFGFLLAAAAASQLTTWHLLHLVEAGGRPYADEPAFVLNRGLGLVGSAVGVIGSIAALIGVIVSGRRAGDGRARVMFGVSAAAWIILIGCNLLGQAMIMELGRLDPDSRWVDLWRASWMVPLAVWPVAVIALLLGLRSAWPETRPAGAGLVGAVALICVGHSATAIAVHAGAKIEIPFGRWSPLFDLALQVVVMGGVLMAVQRARRGAEPTMREAVPVGARDRQRVASGLDIFAGGVIVRAAVALVGLLLHVVATSGDGEALAYLVTILGCLGGDIAMAVGLHRVRGALGPAAARVAGGAAALLMLFAAVLGAQFLQLALRWLADSTGTGGGGAVFAVHALAEAMVVLLAWLALLRRLGSLDGAHESAAPAGRWLAMVLIVVVLVSAMFDQRRLLGSWPPGPIGWLPIVGALATLIVSARFAALARGMAARLRSGAPDELPLARAVARERDGDG